MKEEVVGYFLDEEDFENEMFVKEVYVILNDLIKEEVRCLIVDEKIWFDGCKVDEIRFFELEVGLLLRVYGLGLFICG